jgi:hypothetical protein
VIRRWRERRRLRHAARNGPWTPAADAPPCPRCEQDWNVHLWHPPAEFICVGCLLIFKTPLKVVR